MSSLYYANQFFSMDANMFVDLYFDMLAQIPSNKQNNISSINELNTKITSLKNSYKHDCMKEWLSTAYSKIDDIAESYGKWLIKVKQFDSSQAVACRKGALINKVRPFKELISEYTNLTSVKQHATKIKEKEHSLNTFLTAQFSKHIPSDKYFKGTIDLLENIDTILAQKQSDIDVLEHELAELRASSTGGKLMEYSDKELIQKYLQINNFHNISVDKQDCYCVISLNELSRMYGEYATTYELTIKSILDIDKYIHHINLLTVDISNTLLSQLINATCNVKNIIVIKIRYNDTSNEYVFN